MAPINRPSSLAVTPLHLPHLLYTLEVSDTGNLYLEINRRCGLATGVMSNSSWSTKLQVYNATALFVLVYSIEKWPLRKTLTSFIHGLESCALVFNEELNQRTSQLSIHHTIPQHHVCCFGHVLRWPDNPSLRVICKLSSNSQQTTQPLDYVLHQDLQQINLEAVLMPCQDHEGWRDNMALVAQHLHGFSSSIKYTIVS